MGQNRRTFKAQIFNTSAIVTPGVIYSQPIHMNQFDNVGLQFNWQGSTSGQFVVDASIDYSAQVMPGSSGSSGYLQTNPGNFAQYIGSSAIGPQPNGSSGVCLININQCPYNWIRTRYINAAPVGSTGTLSLWVHAVEL